MNGVRLLLEIPGLIEISTRKNAGFKPFGACPAFLLFHIFVQFYQISSTGNPSAYPAQASYTTPWASMASTTFSKPAILAPAT